jgi:FkbM family methyltransferase
MMPFTVRGVTLQLWDHEAVCDAIRAAGDFYEAPILDDLRARRPTERTIIDAGANIGNHAAYWCAFVPHERLVCFEPMPDAFELLCLNAPDAERYECALSDGAGYVFMRQCGANRGMSRVSHDGEVLVPRVRLDDLVFTDVSLVKIDVEGHECRVLAGARETIARDRPALVVEEEVPGRFRDALVTLGLGGYRRVLSWPGSNHLYEW